MSLLSRAELQNQFTLISQDTYNVASLITWFSTLLIWNSVKFQLFSVFLMTGFLCDKEMTTKCWLLMKCSAQKWWVAAIWYFIVNLLLVCFVDFNGWCCAGLSLNHILVWTFKWYIDMGLMIWCQYWAGHIMPRSSGYGHFISNWCLQTITINTQRDDITNWRMKWKIKLP